MRLVLALLAVGLLGCPAVGSAAEVTAPSTPIREGSIAISADRLEADAGLDRLTFSGKVIARQDGTTIYARELSVAYGPDRQVEKVTATGDVRIVQEERVATAEKAEFFTAEEKIVLTGRPRVHQGEDFIEGEEIVVFLDQRRSIVNSGGDARVNAVFHPSGKP